MKFVRTFLAVAIVSLTFIGCKEAEVTEGYLRLNAAAKWDGTPLVIGDTYTDVMNRPILVEQFRTYISNISVTDSDGTEHRLKGVEQLNFNEPWSSDFWLPAGNYTQIKFAMGVPSSLNTDVDPASYPNDNPLSIFGAEGMFWTWASGYIFTKFEGKTAFDGDASNMTNSYAFHVGTDQFYQEHIFAIDFEIGEEREDLTIEFDADKFLFNADDTIDLAEDNLTHTMDNMPLAMRFMELYNSAIRVKK